MLLKKKLIILTKKTYLF